MKITHYICTQVFSPPQSCSITNVKIFLFLKFLFVKYLDYSQVSVAFYNSPPFLQQNVHPRHRLLLFHLTKPSRIPANKGAFSFSNILLIFFSKTTPVCTAHSLICLESSIDSESHCFFLLNI